MLLKVLVICVLVAALALTAPLAGAQELQNVILMIADGWGYNQIAATKYWYGSAQAYEAFPVRLGMSTYSWNTLQVDPEGYDPSLAWSDWEYMLLRATDSAAAASAMSTGVKCRNAQINTHPDDGQPLFMFRQLAEQLGKSTGVVTSVQWSHATPAAFGAHNPSRDNYVAIAQEMVSSSGLEVIMGAGNPFYDDNGVYTTPSGESSYRYVGGSALWDDLVGGATPYTLVQTRAEFQALMTGPAPARVCGTAQVRETLQQSRTPTEVANSMTPPYTVPQIETVPTLAEMSRGTLNVLDDNPLGFFLMIEGGAVDWACHDNQGGRLIEEMTDFTQAVEAVIAWVETNSSWNETMVIVTGDHECGYLWAPGSGLPAQFNPIVDHGAGQMPGMRYFSGDHANSLIPFFAKGSGSGWFSGFADQVDPVRGSYVDNAEIADVVFGLLDHTLAVTEPVVSGADGRAYALYQNHPNPFNPATRVIYSMKETGRVSLRVFSPGGRQVATLVNGMAGRGVHAADFDGRNLPSGLYICQMEVGDFKAQQKMLLMK